MKWYHKAAVQGNAEAQFSLGSCYDFGTGVEQNYIEAVKWYRNSAEQGHAAAQYNLGMCYKRGRGVKKDHAEGDRWLSKAQKQQGGLCLIKSWRVL